MAVNGTSHGNALQKALLGIILMLGVGWAGEAFASASLGGNCTGCHTSTYPVPATHPPLAQTPSTMCMACHKPPAAGSAATTGAQSAANKHVTFTQKQEREREKVQEQARTQRILRRGNPFETGVRNQRRGRGSQGNAHEGEEGKGKREGLAAPTQVADKSPFALKVTVGVLASRDIDQHRSNSLFHDDVSHLGASFMSGHDAKGESIAGTRYHLGLSAGYSIDLNDRDTLTFGVGSHADRFPELKYNRFMIVPRVEWKRKWQGGSFKVKPYWQTVSYSGSAAATHTEHVKMGVDLNWEQSIAESTSIITRFRVRQNDYKGEPGHRRPSTHASVAFRKAFEGRGNIIVGFSKTEWNNSSKAKSRFSGVALFAGTSRAITDTTTIGLTGEIGKRNYKAFDPKAGLIQKDDFLDIGVSVSDSRLKVGPAIPRLSCHYVTTNSNVRASESKSAYCGVVMESRF